MTAVIKMVGSEFRARTDVHPDEYKPQARLLRQANWRWDSWKGIWETSDMFSAAMLWRRDEFVFDSEAIAKAGDALEVLKNNLESSVAIHSDYDSPVPAGLDYFPFQKAGIEFFEANKNILIADEMGLGKTIQAIGVINNHPEYKKILIICPASIRLNWQNELKTWLTRKMSIGIATPWYFPGRRAVVIINYDILKKQKAKILRQSWDLVIADESHYMKNPSAIRTKAGKEIVDSIPRRIFMSGTPFPNNPSELFSQLQMLDPATWSNRLAFERKYAGYDKKAGQRELNRRLRAGGHMIRRLKRDVLTMLPPKIRQIVLLDPASPDLARALEVEKLALSKFSESWELIQDHYDGEYDKQIAQVGRKIAIAFEEIARVRHDTAVAKAPYVAKQAQELLESGAEKLVLFAHHHDVIDILTAELKKFKPVLVTGRTKMADRQANVDKFQNDPDTRVFIGSLRAASLGFTLTAGTVAMFAELDWSPGVVTQAEDRLHRIGQDDNVHIQHIVIDGSIDSMLAEKLILKQKAITNTLDARVDRNAKATVVIGGEAAKEFLRETFDDNGYRPVQPTRRTNKPKYDRSMVKKTPVAKIAKSDKHNALVEALKLMCSTDGDMARELNGVGFNKLDTGFGHSLNNAVVRYGGLTDKQVNAGAKMMRKYHSQIGVDLIARMG